MGRGKHSYTTYFIAESVKPVIARHNRIYKSTFLSRAVDATRNDRER